MNRFEPGDVIRFGRRRYVVHAMACGGTGHSQCAMHANPVAAYELVNGQPRYGTGTVCLDAERVERCEHVGVDQ